MQLGYRSIFVLVFIICALLVAWGEAGPKKRPRSRLRDVVRGNRQRSGGILQDIKSLILGDEGGSGRISLPSSRRNSRRRANTRRRRKSRKRPTTRPRTSQRGGGDTVRPVSPTSSTTNLIGFSAPNPIPDRFIVRVDEAGNAAVIRNQILRLGGQILEEITFNGKRQYLAVKLNSLRDAALDRLLSIPGIASIEQDRWISVLDLAAEGDGGECYSKDMPRDRWFLDRLDQLDLPLDNKFNTSVMSLGEGVTVYLLDTGVYAAHREFGGRIIKETLACEIDAASDYSLMCSPGDKHGHGTHMAGTIVARRFGVAPGASVHSVKVFTDQGLASIFSITSGLEKAHADYLNLAAAGEREPAVVSMSLAAIASTDPDASGQGALEDSIEILSGDGMTVVAAAGNRGNIPASLMTPARSPHAITVGCIDRDDTMCQFSSYGDAVNILAPGIDILSTWISPGNYRRLNGTSSAAALVSGSVALHLAQTSSTEAGSSDHVLFWFIVNGARERVQGSLKGTTNLIAQVSACN